MYWTDDRYNRIWMANLNGTRATIVISTRLLCPGWNIYVLEVEEDTLTY